MSYLDVKRPRGAPDIGARVVESLPFDDIELELTVVGYLSEQFIAETDDGQRRIIHVNGLWQKAKGTDRAVVSGR